MGEMSDMLKLTATANAALQEQVVELATATANGRDSDQKAHAEQQKMQGAVSAQIGTLAATLNSFIEHSQREWQERLEGGQSSSQPPRPSA